MLTFKRIILFLSIFSISFLAACSSKSAETKGSGVKTNTTQRSLKKREQTASSSSSNTSKQGTIAYQSMSSDDRQHLIFDFQVIPDASGNTNPNIPSEMQVVAQIHNNSNKRVVFDLSKFMIVVPGYVKNSDKTGKIKIDPNKEFDVGSLFVDVNAQAFVSAGAFCYDNNDLKLAYTYLASGNGDVTSANLTNTQIIEINRAEDQTQQKNTDTQNVITNGMQAIRLVSHAEAIEPDTLSVEERDGGWHVYRGDDVDAQVSPNGSVTWDNGETQTYEELSKPTTSGF